MANNVSCCWLLLLFLFSSISAQYIDVNDVLPSDYNAMIRPGNLQKSDSFNVTISIYVHDLVSASDKDQTVTLDLIMIQKWTDTRLNLSLINGNFIVSKPADIKKFWMPSLYFVNGQSVTVVNAFQAIQKLTITNDGQLRYAQRINAILNCPMNLQNYPHDYQYCRVQISPLILNESAVRLVWDQFEVYSQDNNLFLINYWYTADCAPSDNPIPENSCISGTLKLVRRLSYYIIRYYLLTFLTICISMVQLWVPVNAWPARITLIVNPVLQLITQDITINNDIGVYYVVSIHWWMMWLQGMIYVNLVEYAVAIQWAHFITDKKYYAKLMKDANNNGGNGSLGPNGTVPNGTAQNGNDSSLTLVPAYVQGYYFGNNGWYAKCGDFFERFTEFFFGPIDFYLDPYTRNKVDYVCRVIFTFLFLLFTFLYVMITTIYWSANYLEKSPNES